MISRQEFQRRTNLSHEAFLSDIFPIGGSLNGAKTRIEAYLRSCADFRKRTPKSWFNEHSSVCGTRDAKKKAMFCAKCLQERALTHLGILGRTMWRRYHGMECACHKAGLLCPGEGGTCQRCYVEYAAWERAIFNIRENA